MKKSVFTKKYKKLRELLVQYRDEANVSQVELAKRLGTRQTFISKCELGERRVDVVEMMLIADALGIDPVDVIKELKKVSD
ncbi:helix-turn-helix domain-containing protein [Emcibacter nanhaiensis]|uniref:Helix-turn-helix transcriptional regulator n=1 Tax=Emcibacter nanhaiensis TaxID=1505037 RepID=A0A501PWA2_9PROT|nr:helix-turn-helix transcriptional regulator [Emcibacter nanhaiensis]TPD64001.1 helix-turn-helix transcriptional regulator [Emcibacter nanhaiensis]